MSDPTEQPAGASSLPDAGAARRASRVRTLLAAIIVLSVADLAVTIGHLRSVGMIEANPIAAWLIETTRSPWVLAAYKAVTVAICVGLLDRVRHHRSGEIAAWLGVGILTCLSFLWHSYAQEMESPGEIALVQVEMSDHWHQLD